MAKMKMYRTFTENLPTIFRKNYFFTKLVQNHFPKVFVDFQIFRELSKQSPRISRKIIAQEFYQKHFSEFHNFPKSSENFKTMLINVHFQFCLTVESIRQDGAILLDDQPIKLLESRAGRVAINNC